MKNSTHALFLFGTICTILTGCDRASPEQKAWRDETFHASEKMEALLVEGLDPNLETGGSGYRDFLLNRAVKYRRAETVRVLLEHGAEPDKRTWAYHKTPLFQSAYDGSLEIAALLLDFGADLNAVDDVGNNALREAVLANQVRMVSFLLEQGIDPLHANNDGRTMYDIAKKHTKPAITSLISEHVEKNGGTSLPANGSDPVDGAN